MADPMAALQQLRELKLEHRGIRPVKVHQDFSNLNDVIAQAMEKDNGILEDALLAAMSGLANRFNHQLAEMRTDIVEEIREVIRQIEMPEQIDPVDYSDALEAIEKRLEKLEAPKKYEFDVQRLSSNPMSAIKKVTATQK